MRTLMQILGGLLLLALLYAIVVGLGLNKSFKRSKFFVKTQMINDFEYPRDDFDWTTGGYVKMEPSTENKTHGKSCAKVTFYPTNQFYPTPVPGMAPTNSSQVFYSAEGKAAWRPQIILDTTSVTRLDVNEWQDYESLKMDVFNSEDQAVTYHIQVADAQTFVFETSGELAPKKVTKIEVPLLGLVEKRMDLTSIRSLRFWVEMTDATQPIVVYPDNIRLEGDMATAVKKEEAARSGAGPKLTPTPAK